METLRKRPRTEDTDIPRSKKRALTEERDSSGNVNSPVSDVVEEPADGDNLEMFRKDAIFRRMKHYSREHERSEARIVELERRRNTCEAGLAALEACWLQLVGTIRSLVKPEDLPDVDVKTEELFDLTATVSCDLDPQYIDGLRNKMRATEQLVTAFVRLGGNVQPSILQDEMYRRCQKAQSECSTLRSEVSLVRARLRDAESQKEKYHEQLVAAQKRVDRLQSKTLAAARLPPKPEKEQVKDESPRGTPSSPPPPQPAVNGVHSHSSEPDEWQAIAKIREEKAEELARENTALREELEVLKLELKVPSEEFIVQSAYYKQLQEQASVLKHAHSEAQAETSRWRDELELLVVSRKDWQEELATANEKAVQELRNMLAKRDNENSRLREQRDQQLSEINERKQKEHVKFASLNEYKTLAASRSERIKVLQSEIARLKTRMAADAGNEDLMRFLFKDIPEDISYVDDLKSRLAAAQSRNDSLEASLSFFQEEHPDVVQHMRRETEATHKLADLTRQLQEYQSVFGDALSALPPDVQILSEQLRRKEDEIQKLRLQVEQRQEEYTGLCAEVGKLSVEWENLDSQVKSKVFDLSAMEERLTKSGLDKAKSENKFYSAMRDKEAVETERKNLARNLEKQAKAVERLKENETILTSQIHDLEKEAIAWRKAASAQRDRVHLLEAESAEWKTRAEGERKRGDDIRAAFHEYEKTVEKRRGELRRAEEGLVRLKKEAEKHAAKMKSVAQSNGPNANIREAELQSEVDKCMSILKCSTCRMHMRNTVITKCMHSFCRNCVNDRISTRQRKCPACNLPFSQGEVQQLYFQ